jgi:hypothetical protein
MASFQCPTCRAEVSLADALERGEFSWPEMATFWVGCESCEMGMHFMAREGALVQIRIVAAPGPEWEEVTVQPAAGLTFRADPSFLHVWALGRHYEYGART